MLELANATMVVCFPIKVGTQIAGTLQAVAPHGTATTENAGPVEKTWAGN